MLKPAGLGFFFIFLCLILQSTLLQYVAIGGVVPNLALVVLLYMSNKTGSLPGLITGFATGLVEDFISLSPIGFHAFMKTLSGYLYGFTKGKVFADSLILPPVLTAIALILQMLLSLLMVFLLRLTVYVPTILDGAFWIELLYTALLSPLVFWLLKLTRLFQVKESEALR